MIGIWIAIVLSLHSISWNIIACGEIVDIRGRSLILGAPATCQSNQWNSRSPLDKHPYVIAKAKIQDGGEK